MYTADPYCSLLFFFDNGDAKYIKDKIFCVSRDWKPTVITVILKQIVEATDYDCK